MRYRSFLKFFVVFEFLLIHSFIHSTILYFFLAFIILAFIISSFPFLFLIKADLQSFGSWIFYWFFCRKFEKNAKRKLGSSSDFRTNLKKNLWCTRTQLEISVWVSDWPTTDQRLSECLIDQWLTNDWSITIRVFDWPMTDQRLSECLIDQ